ncbi:MAG TPA: family 78 glycoside hydrolase catalytic domain [Verrucomicrobiae bacterium]|nr:family 78 glycoside hydrolase catalytic domain [Verrucomicrobiae bacterium]
MKLIARQWIECFRLVATALFLGGAVVLGAAAELHPSYLRCEYRRDPLGIDETRPRLTWLLDGSDRERGQKQLAYQILVASTPELLAHDEGDLWDSGKVASDDTVNIVYAGKPLISRQECFWKARVWDQDGHPSKWSQMARWSMGLLSPSDWHAQYISFRDHSPVFKDSKTLFLPPARQYRKEFAADKRVKRATLYATALGIYELQLNGRRVGDAIFAPGWTDYHQRAYYNTYDVTRSIHKGENALGAWVADGWYSGYVGFGLLTGIGTERIGRYTYGKTPALLAQLEIEYIDGTKQVIVTDGSWKLTGKGPIQEADLLMGELYDARHEMRGWSEPGFNDSHWEPAILASENGAAPATFYQYENPPPGGAVKIVGHKVDLGFKRPDVLQAFPGMPVRHIQEIKPIEMTSPSPGVYIFNLGQNIAGVARLKVKGPAGACVRLRYGEMLYADGRLMTENLRKARATDFYILRGDRGGETYTPRFTSHGFQYVEVSGFPGKPGADAITGIVMHSDTPMTSAFECADPMVNHLFKNVVWTQRANFIDLPTDCPQRDERFGWTGDAQIFIRAATYNADAAAFYTKWIRELMESQRPSGVFPGYAPFPFQHGLDFGTAWCDAGVICPWTIYEVYGDKRIIGKCWDSMTRFMEWRKKESKNFLGVVHGNAWGDWLSLNETTPLDYIDTAYFAGSTKLMARMAAAIGHEAEAAEYRDLFARIKSAFAGKYLKPDGTLTVDTQTAYALALEMDLFPAEQRKAAAATLARKVVANENRMSTGFLGTRAIVPVLAANGQNDVALRLLQSHKFPSWGYEIDQGATTIWERWNSYTKDKGFGGQQNASMNSFCHYSPGAICEWLFSGLAGIDTEGPGFAHLLIRPMPPNPGSNPDHKPIDWVRAHYDSIHGRVSSSWRVAHGNFDFDLTIPPNTTATIFLPIGDVQKATESRHPLNQSRGLKMVRVRGNRVVLEAQSGTYHFRSPGAFSSAPAAVASSAEK